ncbi:MAG TPA: 1-acyl-sn-glycerol-3-phosphate acyltransferase, partial [Steroidobacteraceae bacterium]|nr:1-acyl-sn-glycerol-3-phosphate acyltransferase [Steroidobacteraceae bacterium]
MFQTITVPVWLAIIVALLAAWAALSRLLLPSVRWIWTRRINRLTERVNRRLALKIPPIARTKREALIDRLVHDPQVAKEIAVYCEREQVPYAIALKSVEEYAREIVPSFNAYVYFSLGSSLAKRIAEWLYRVRLGHADYKSLRAIGSNASVVFVMNHRSNMDYLLVTYLASKRMALSYAVGEWAKVWPIQQIIRTLGAYFVRRGSGDPLYRRVLERYVQMAVEGGAVQAIFPEGSLSRDGFLRKPKVGLLDYMLRSFDPAAVDRGAHDIVFVPVAVNYDRVLEDRTLLLDTSTEAERKSGFAAVRQTLAFVFSQFGLMLRRKWYRFGYACANFGTPISLREYLRKHHWNPSQLDQAARAPHVQQLAADLMMSVGRIVPVLPVSLIAKIFVDAPGKCFTENEIKTQALKLQQRYQSLGAHVYIPRDDTDYSIAVGLRMLTLRRL